MKRFTLGLIAGIGAALIATRLSRARLAISFEGRVVVVTGGSRGLGLVLARMLVDEGARVVLLARDLGELERAREELSTRGRGEVLTLRCDVRRRAEVRAAIDTVLDRWRSIDVLINNAGIIQVGPLEHMDHEDFENAMATHFWGPLHLILEVTPVMRHRRFGRIVNISSIGGKIAVPHLAPYCASKFALAGLSSAMHAELAKDGVLVTTVYPGLMRTGSHINALFKGQNEKEFAMFSIMNGSPFTSVSAENAARQIVEATAKGRAELVISPQAKAAVKINALFPNITSAILAATNQLLPSNGGIGRRHATGLESTSAASPSMITSMVDAAS